MPAPQKLTDKRRNEALEELRQRFRQAERGDYHNLMSVIGLMKELGFRKYQGFSYGQLKSLYEYVGRMYFNRRLTLMLQGFAFKAEVGDMLLPTKPAIQEMRFQLESHDRTRVLICVLWVESKGTTLTKEELHVGLGELVGALPPVAIMHYRSNSGKGRRCLTCDATGCYQHSMASDTQIPDIYQRGGIEEVWKVLDKAWIELTCRRPPRRPLSKQELWVRFYMHQSEPVKVIALDGPYVGDFKELVCDSSGSIKAVRLRTERWEPLGNSADCHEIPAEKILDIQPCRLEYSSWGVPAYYS